MNPDEPSRLRRRRPRRAWVEPSNTRCNICGFVGEHSNVCPYGATPTGRRRPGDADRATPRAGHR